MAAPTPNWARFTLADVLQTARDLLTTHPEPVVAYRLLREVVRVPPGHPELTHQKNLALTGKWVHQLEASQLPDGSWGRFHSQDTKRKTVFRTTEEAIDRAFALGLESGEGVLKQTSLYCMKVLDGAAHLTDRSDKNPAFPLLIKYIVAGRLAQIEPANETLVSYWKFLLDITDQAFSSGSYSLRDEEKAFLRLSGVHVPGGFLESQHSLWLLSSRHFPAQLEYAYTHWIWDKPDGIRYIRAPLHQLSAHRIAYWLRSMNILSRFASWREISVAALNQLWTLRNNDGLWDFGSKIARSIEFPLSQTWRQAIKRKQDYSTHILILLRKYFD